MTNKYTAKQIEHVIPRTEKADSTAVRKSTKKKKIGEKTICEAKGGGTEDLRIIASISWGCVGDGNGGISQRSSQSNGIYVQHSGLQPGNKCLSPPRSDFLTPSLPFLSVSLSPLYLQYLCLYLPLSLPVYLILILYSLCIFLFTSFSLSPAFSLTTTLYDLLQMCRT